MTKLLAILAAFAAVASIAAGSAAASTPTHVFLCYSRYQQSPGVWAEPTAATLLDRGYWLPTAQKSVVTDTSLGHGWYLTCNVPYKTAASVYPKGLVGETGHLITSPARVAALSRVDGYYPAIP